jgi:hypothetical protein
MRKITRFSIVTLFVASLVLLSVSTVFAVAPATSQRTWNDPFVSTAAKGVTFTTAVLVPGSLPGTVTSPSGMTLPTGFLPNQAQFGGSGIAISGLTSAQNVTVCFDFPVYRYSWYGIIYEWVSTKWEKMPTKIVDNSAEGGLTSACAAQAGNGTYSLIIFYWSSTTTPKPAL